MNEKRIKKLQNSLKNPILIKKNENLFYLTGRSFNLRAEEYLLVTKKNLVGFGSGLEQMDWIKKTDRLKFIGKYFEGKKLDIEYAFSYGEGEYLKYKLPKVKVGPAHSPVDVMRAVKEPSEIALVKKSMQIVERVFAKVKAEIKKPGMTEAKLARFIEALGLKMGAGDISFPAIVASGANAAIPHHVPSNKKLKKGESIIIDFGFKYKNYCSDFTRTVFLKTVPRKMAEAYNQVEKAYNESIKFASLVIPEATSKARAVRNPSFQVNTYKPRKRITGNELYLKAVEVLSEKNLEKYFIHSLGHGTGLEIHELPNLSPGSKDVLLDNMIFSIEPGVYIKNIGGIRIEDLVYLEKGQIKKFINVSTNLKDNVI